MLIDILLYFSVAQLQYLTIKTDTIPPGLCLTVICGVLKIMWKNWNFIMRQIHHLTAVEKHLEGDEYCFPAQFSMWTELFKTLNMFFNSCHNLWQLGSYDCWIMPYTLETDPVRSKLIHIRSVMMCAFESDKETMT